MERLETSILARMGIADPYSANPAKSLAQKGRLARTAPPHSNPHDNDRHIRQ